MDKSSQGHQPRLSSPICRYS